MKDEVAKRLIDAFQATERVREFTEGLDFPRFSESALIRSAVERQFEIIGEALGQADKEDPEVAVQVPELRRVVGLRNRLIHGYDSVDDEIVWDIIQTKLPALRAALQQLLRSSGY